PLISEDIKKMFEILDEDGIEPWVPNKPILMVLQGQGRFKMARERPEIHRRNPNKIETRFVAYSSIVNGAKGIWWWGTADLLQLRDEKGRLTQDGEFWEIIKMVSREIDELKEVFTTDRILKGFSTSDDRLESALFNYNDTNYLIVTNKSNQSIMHAKIKADDCNWKKKGKSDISVMFEQRKVVSEDGVSWEDSFAPWDVHIYVDK
ncbi:MAG: hypothetical protein SNJ70_11170, partial [Armatimonadota bacterium]